MRKPRLMRPATKIPRSFPTGQTAGTAGGLWIPVCSLEGKELEDSDRFRAEIMEKTEEILRFYWDPVVTDGETTLKRLEEAMKLAQRRVESVQKHNIWARFVTALLTLYGYATAAIL